MHDTRDDFYYDRTWFDVLGDWLAQRLRRTLPSNRERLWTVGFASFAALCVAWAAGLATQAVLMETACNQRAAELVAAGLLLAAARHFLGVTSLSAAHALIGCKPVARARPPVAVEAPPQVNRPVAVAPTQSPSPADIAAAAQTFFRALREAGINVRIAQSLHGAGFRNAAQIRGCSDAQLLAIPGVGRATLGKLRARFGLPQTGASSSNAA